jgi:hypothetical protein
MNKFYPFDKLSYRSFRQAQAPFFSTSSGTAPFDTLGDAKVKDFRGAIIIPNRLQTPIWQAQSGKYLEICRTDRI